MSRGLYLCYSCNISAEGPEAALSLHPSKVLLPLSASCENVEESAGCASKREGDECGSGMNPLHMPLVVFCKWHIGKHVWVSGKNEFPVRNLNKR